MVLVEILLEDVVVGVSDINHPVIRRGDLMIVKCSLHGCNSSCELARVLAPAFWICLILECQCDLRPSHFAFAVPLKCFRIESAIHHA